ncbi:MAG: 30S ribosome-binding factor RbfA [Bacteroidales bacterium]|nr:30S ribosome-binding factor RbfA [Bacteroidales bacterium]
MQSTRQEKISRLIQKELGDIFLIYSRENAGALVSVTQVRVTSDLSIARIYLSLFPHEKVEDLFNQIKEDTKKIRFELGNRTRHQLRVIPELQFYIDDSLDYLENIDRLLKL